MNKELSILAVITARGGSKSIPRKNIKELLGKPLLAYTIEAAQKSKLTRTILSTDDHEIASIGKDYGVEVPFLRPAELATDTSTSIEAVQHALQVLKETEGKVYDYLMILQPTSPLRTAEDIDASIDIALRTDADSVMSMVELEDFSPKKLKKVNDDGSIEPFFEDEGTLSARRQDEAKVYRRNAAIYLTKTEHILNGDLFGKKSYAYIMPPQRSVDINALHDFEFAEHLMKKYGL